MSAGNQLQKATSVGTDESPSPGAGNREVCTQIVQTSAKDFIYFIYLFSLAGSKPMNRYKEKYNMEKI